MWNTWGRPWVFCGVHLLNLFLLCCPIMCLYVLCSVLWCPLWFPHKKDVRFFFFIPPVVCRGLVLFTSCVYLRIMLCFYFVFLRLVCHMLPVSLDCPFLIASSVFPTVYDTSLLVLFLLTIALPVLRSTAYECTFNILKLLLIDTQYLCHKWSRICSVCLNHNWVLFLSTTCHRVCNIDNMTGVTSGAETATLPLHLSLPTGSCVFHGGQSLFFCVVFCRSLFVFLSIFFLMTIVLCIFLRYTVSDYHLWYFQTFLTWYHVHSSFIIKSLFGDYFFLHFLGAFLLSTLGT